MTADELRALDAEVAVKVFGWRYCLEKGRHYDSVLRPPTANEGYRPEFVTSEPTERPLVPNGMPHYSTDIAAAWQVLEVMHRKGFRVVIEDWRDDAENAQVWGAYFNAPGGHTTAQVCGPTAPLAVCRAALKALESM